MPFSTTHIQDLIRSGKIELAIACLDAVDGDLCILLQSQLEHCQQEYIRGVIAREEWARFRSELAFKILSYLKIHHNTQDIAVMPETTPAAQNMPGSEGKSPENYLLPIEKTLIQQHLDMEKPVSASSPKIMTFYFLERKELAITAALECLEQYRQDGHPTIIGLLSTLRESADALRDLHEVLLSSGFRQDPLTQTARKCADLCIQLRRELTRSALKKDSMRSDVEDVEILLHRILRQIKEIRSSAERFSES